MITAVKRCNMLVLQFLLSVPGIDVNVRDKSGTTALCQAALFDFVAAAQLLLQHPDIQVKRLPPQEQGKRLGLNSP